MNKMVKTFKINPKICMAGCESEVYFISPSSVVKVDRDGFSGIEKEYEKMKELYQTLPQLGINMPEPIDLVKVILHHPHKDKPREINGILMEHLHAIRPEWMTEFSPYYPRIKELFEEGSKIIREAGWSNKDSAPEKNTMYNPSEDKLYFIDFQHWEKISSE